jgi:hypothetical protein
MDGNNPCLGLTGILFLLLAVRTLWGVFKNWKQYRASAGWQPIPARILDSRVEESESGSGEDYSVSYSPIITYEYQTMGQSYRGNLIAFGSEGIGYGSRKKAEKVIARHPTGTPVTVYYNPADPSQSVLERNFNWSSAVSGIAIALISAWMIYVGYVQ